MSQANFANVLAISYKQSFLALTSIIAVATSVLFAPDATAQLTVGSGGTCTKSSLCTSTKPKRCSAGYCTYCSQACTSSLLGGSVWGLFSGAQLPVDDPDTTDFDESPVFGHLLTDGPTFGLKCTQGSLECPFGLPAVQSTQTVTIRKSSQSTITLTSEISGLPTPPFKVQVAGTRFNDGVYPVIQVSAFPALVLTLGESARRNETSVATVALANITLTFTDKDGNVGAGKVYLRHLDDSVSPPRCLTPTGNPTVCEDGVATATGEFKAELKCANNGTQLTLPCQVQAFAGDGQSASFVSQTGQNNFNACLGTACEIKWNDVVKGNCKRFFPETEDFAACQTLEFTITAGDSISNFLHRALNTAMAPFGTPSSFAFSTSTDTPGGIPVDITATPNPLNAAEVGTISVKIQNNGAANLSKVDVASVVLTHANYAAGGFRTVNNDQAPEQCTDGNCWVFKFNRACFLDAYLQAQGSKLLPGGTEIFINLNGAFKDTSGEIFGETSVITKGDYIHSANDCSAVIN